MARPTASSLRVLALVRERLEPDGWTVREDHSGDYFNIEVSHPLTSTFGLGFPNDDSDQRAFVERSLAAREFGVIAARPDEIVHESLLGRLRVAAQANRWDHAVVAIVARVLRHEGVLTEAESEWLELAGPAWAEDEPPQEFRPARRR